MNNPLDKAAKHINNWQQQYAAPAIAVATLKKYGDDHGNNYAAIITFYSFLALFPLLLVMLTVLEIVLSSHTSLRDTILNSTLANVPVLSDELRRNVSALSGTGFRIAVGLTTALLGTMGAANAMRMAINDIWGIPQAVRIGFPYNYIRNLGIVLVAAVGFAATTIIAGYIAFGASSVYYGAIYILNFGLFLIGFRLAVSSTIKVKQLLVSAALASFIWEVLQAIGSLLIARQLSQLNVLYGSFAVVLGLLYWLYLLVRLTLYAVVGGMVFDAHLWPRSLDNDNLTDADKRALALYVEKEKRLRQENVHVGW